MQLLRALCSAQLRHPWRGTLEDYRSETNPTRQNILAPARKLWPADLVLMDALKALQIFDRSTLAIISASERAGKLTEGIPTQSIQLPKSVKQRRNYGDDGVVGV